jgi:hypothetical protein
MKILFFAIMFTLIACGKEEALEDGRGLGELRNPIVAPVTSGQRANLDSLCQILRDKDANFRVRYVNNYSQFNFSTKLKNCQGSEQNGSATAQLAVMGSDLQYTNISGNFFSTAFETATSGTISTLCKDTALTNPKLISSTTALWFDITSGVTCSSNPNIRCVTMEIAFRQPSGQFLVTIIDKFQVDFQQTLMAGMVLKHDRYDLSTCSNQGGRVENTSVFTGVTQNN